MKIIIYGVGKFSEYVTYVFTHDTNYQICGFCCEKGFISENQDSLLFPIVDFDSVTNHFPPSEYKLFIAVGNNKVRERIYSKSKELGYTLISYISTKAIVWEDLIYGDNVFISEDTGIQPFVTIGNNSILIGPKIGHHSVIGKNTLLSCCYLAGSVNIGNNTFIGLNASLKQNLIIGSFNIIGMGCIIEKNTNDFEIYKNSKVLEKRLISSERYKKYV